jgi:HD-GYP domain-containing protein (c-di-GMP phosphodiesterase class II)
MVHVDPGNAAEMEPESSSSARPAGIKLLAASKLHDFLAANSELPAEQQRYLGTLCEVVASHHERWDGTGYPEGLAGDDIPLPGRIAALVDAYESLVSERPYRPARTHDEAVTIITSEAGTRFDPQLVECFSRAAAQLG